jgi:hypothetical protein
MKGVTHTTGDIDINLNWHQFRTKMRQTPFFKDVNNHTVGKVTIDYAHQVQFEGSGLAGAIPMLKLASSNITGGKDCGNKPPIRVEE